MSGTYYKTPQPVVDRKCSECGNGEPDLSLYCVSCLNNDGWHLDENWTPQPVVDVNDLKLLIANYDFFESKFVGTVDFDPTAARNRLVKALLSAGKETV